MLAQTSAEIIPPKPKTLATSLSSARTVAILAIIIQHALVFISAVYTINWLPLTLKKHSRV